MNSTRRSRILIVDDEPAIRTLIAEILAHNTFEMQEAGSVSEAIRILADFTPDLLITDYSLPDANGSELIERAKAIFPDIKCLLLTGWRDISDHISTASLADVVMSKPFSIEALEMETRRLLSTNSTLSVTQEVR
jgi:DNA-binding response OmpR family regulator